MKSSCACLFAFMMLVVLRSTCGLQLNQQLAASFLSNIGGNLNLGSPAQPGTASETNDGADSSDGTGINIVLNDQPGSSSTGAGGPAPPQIATLSNTMQERQIFYSAEAEIKQNLTVLETRYAELKKYYQSVNVMEADQPEAVQTPTFSLNFRKALAPTGKGKTIEDRLKTLLENLKKMETAIDEYKQQHMVPDVDTGSSSSTGGEPDDSDPVEERRFSSGWNTRFTDRQYFGFIDDKDLGDPAGLAFSRKHANLGILYAVNDKSGKTNHVFVLNGTDGSVMKKIQIIDTLNNDWEDLACGPCDKYSQDTCIYIGDIGRNYDKEVGYSIYKVREPDFPLPDEVEYVERIRFEYEPSSGTYYGMETLMVAPDASIYGMPERYKSNDVDLVRLYEGGSKVVGTANFGSDEWGPVGGDISASGEMMIIRTYENIFLFHVSDGNYGSAVENNQRVTLDYTLEYDGQSVAINPNETMYVTVSEEEFPAIWKYMRLYDDEI